MKSKPDEKGDNDDALKQSNKSHKGMREKLKKRRKQEKDIKKQKKEKKKQAKLKELKKKERKERKERKREENGSDSSDDDREDSKLLKYIKKLKIFMEEEADDLFEMLETLDAGGEVMIEELENGKVKNYLKKIFKYFGLKKNSETKEFSKPADITINLKKTFQDLWYEGVDTDSDDSDDEKKKGKKMDEESEEDEEEQEAKKVLNEEEVAKAKNALLEGIKQLPHDAPKEKEEEGEDGVKRIKGEEWRSFLDEKFGSLVGEDKKGYSKLGKKGGASGEEERTDRDKKIDEFMTDYNSQFRKKTLLEEHQERKRNAAMGKPVERRAFDKDLDVNMSRIDSKKVFQMINNKDNNLTSRFGHSGSGNKYL